MRSKMALRHGKLTMSTCQVKHVFMTIKRRMRFVQFVGQCSRIGISEISILIIFISQKTMLDATVVIIAKMKMV